MMVFYLFLSVPLFFITLLFNTVEQEEVRKLEDFHPFALLLYFYYLTSIWNIAKSVPETSGKCLEKQGSFVGHFV